MSFLDDFFGGGDTPPPPDYSPYLGMFKDIASSAKQHGEEALTYARDQITKNTQLTDQVNKGMLDTQQVFGKAGKDAVAGGQKITGEGTDFLEDMRAKYTDPSKIADQMGAAEANTAQAIDAQREASQRAMEGYGVNPAEVRFGLDGPARVAEAAAKASAGTGAARHAEQIATAANQALLTQGNADVQSGINLTAQGNAAGTGAVNNNLNTTASGQQGLGTGVQWSGQQTAGTTGGVDTTNKSYQNQIDQQKLEQSSSSGLGSLGGALLGAAGKGGALASGGALSGLIPAATAFLDDGGVVPEGGISLGSPQGAVPMAASPSNGAVTDDVPATGPSGAIRLSGGEFVIPKDAVSWLGEKTLQDLILKARKGKEGAQAKPTVGPAPPAQAPQPAIG